MSILLAAITSSSTPSTAIITAIGAIIAAVIAVIGIIWREHHATQNAAKEARRVQTVERQKLLREILAQVPSADEVRAGIGTAAARRHTTRQLRGAVDLARTQLDERDPILALLQDLEAQLAEVVEARNRITARDDALATYDILHSRLRRAVRASDQIVA